MRRLVSLVLLCLGLPCPGSLVCLDGLLRENRNAALAPAQYTQTLDRTLERYGAYLQEPFLDAYGPLGPGDVWIDLGAGRGRAAREAAIRKGLHAIAINAQDFREGTVPEGVRFDYRVGLAELLLPTLTVQARLITDLYGAYFYGARRAQLVGSIFERLAVGGTAVLLTDHLGDGAEDLVVHAYGGHSTLLSFLATENPGAVRFMPARTDEMPRPYRYANGVFELLPPGFLAPTYLENAGASLLVLRRSSADETLVLPEYVEGQELRYRTGAPGFEYPTGVRYQTLRPRRGRVLH